MPSPNYGHMEHACSASQLSACYCCIYCFHLSVLSRLEYFIPSNADPNDYVVGVGFNIVTLTSFVIVQQHFKEHRALAAAISACGISVGCLISGPLIRALLDAYEWRGTLLLMSAIALNNCAFGALYRPVTTSLQRLRAPSERATTVATLGDTLRQLGRDMTDLTLFSDVSFTLICLGTFLMNAGLTVFFQHTPSRANSLSVQHYSLLPMIYGIATTVARIFGGVIGNASCTNRLLQYGVSIIAGGSLLVVLGAVVTFELIAIVGAAVAFAAGES
jgi:MFS family permease